MTANTNMEHTHKGVGLFDSLRHDHRGMSTVLDQMKSASPEEKTELLRRLEMAFTIHADSEERYFYLRLRRFSGLMELVHSALAEHDTIRELMQQLAEVDQETVQGSVAWQALFSDLEYAVNQHVHKEEQLIFPRARRQLSPTELNHIKDQIEDEQRKTRPLHQSGEGLRPGTGT
ncbi:hemerythrin domain-containing protein [Geobacter sp. SVR]|uniref:hemerythrin domain-containing protein n=1 Tax=Geobacter sp. SVR TaxID=2495594 RepID=UPI00143F016B|nr:hemerythrin domain-containing protein [Geobacter sp. SVR]BCS52706.1 hemerythrin [Geobacter sp. SVR]GCF86798.1 hypothetical protein GSbR_33980 [Geobacter sp. SVR]